MVQVHALSVGAVRSDPRRGVRRDRRGQFPLPLGELREHRVDGGMVVLQRQQQVGQTTERAGGGDSLRQRLLTESGSALGHVSPFDPLFRWHAFLANLYKIAILYGLTV